MGRSSVFFAFVFPILVSASSVEWSAAHAMGRLPGIAGGPSDLGALFYEVGGLGQAHPMAQKQGHLVPDGEGHMVPESSSLLQTEAIKIEVVDDQELAADQAKPEIALADKNQKNDPTAGISLLMNGSGEGVMATAGSIVAQNPVITAGFVGLFGILVAFAVNRFVVQEAQIVLKGQHSSSTEYGTSGSSSVQGGEEQQPLGFWGLVGCALTICMPCLGAGYNLGAIGASLYTLTPTFGLASHDEGVVMAAYCIGCIFGGMATSAFSFPLGRKKLFLLSCSALLVAQMQMALASSWVAYNVGRAMMGASAGISTSLGSTYIAETSPKAQRGILVSFVEQTISGGLIFGYFVAGFPALGFRQHAYLGLAFPLIGLIFSPFLSESPRWLMAKGHDAEAKRTVRRLIQDTTEAEETIRSIQGNKSEEAEGSGLNFIKSFAELFATPEARAQVFFPCFLMVFEELVGIEASDAYCIQMLAEGGFDSRALIAGITVFMVAVKGVVLILSGHALDVYGRRPALLFSSGSQAITLTTWALSYRIGSPTFTAIAWLSFNFAYASGLGNCAVVVCAESFSNPRLRGPGVAFTFILNRIVAAIMTGLYPAMHNSLGIETTILIWAAFALFLFIHTYIYMKETAGCVLEDCGHGSAAPATEEKLKAPILA